MYLTKTISAEAMGRRLRPAHALLSNRYYIDNLYEGLIVRRLLYRGLFRVTDWLDARVVDGAVDLAGWSGRNVSRAVAQLQTGNTQAYGVGITFGIVIILVTYLTQR